MASAVTEQTTGMILGPDGTPVTLPTTVMSVEDATLLRAYKKFLQRMGLQEALYCKTCGHQNRSDGCESHVTDGDILIRCRCRMRFFSGQTF